MVLALDGVQRGKRKGCADLVAHGGHSARRDFLGFQAYEFTSSITRA